PSGRWPGGGPAATALARAGFAPSPGWAGLLRTRLTFGETSRAAGDARATLLSTISPAVRLQAWGNAKARDLLHGRSSTGGLMHAVIRRYRVRLGTVAEAVRYAEKQFVPLVRHIPGFVACYLMDAGNDVLTSIGLFHTQDGAEAAVSLQRDWFRDEGSSCRPLPPEVVIGAVLAQATADSAVPAERRRLADRRNAAAVLPVGP